MYLLRPFYYYMILIMKIIKKEDLKTFSILTVVSILFIFGVIYFISVQQKGRQESLGSLPQNINGALFKHPLSPQELSLFKGKITIVSDGRLRYINKTFGFSVELPNGVKPLIHQGEVWGKDSVEYKRYYILFQDSSTSTKIFNISVQNTPYTSIDEWYSQNKTNQQYFSEYSKLEKKHVVSGTDALTFIAPFELTYPKEQRTQRTFFIHNGLLYDITLGHLSPEEQRRVWGSFEFITDQ